MPYILFYIKMAFLYYMNYCFIACQEQEAEENIRRLYVGFDGTTRGGKEIGSG